MFIRNLVTSDLTLERVSFFTQNEEPPRIRDRLSKYVSSLEFYTLYVFASIYLHLHSITLLKP